VTDESQAVWFNGVPLVALAALYLGVSVAITPSFVRRRAGASLIDWAQALLFPCVGIAAALFGAQVLVDRSPIGGDVWLPFAATLLAAVPPFLFALRLGDRALVAAGVRQAREAEERARLRERELRSIETISGALARAGDAESVARVLLDEIAALFSVEFAGLALVDERMNEAVGLLARRDGQDFDYWRGLRFDLRREPSGIASAAFEVAPVTVYDTGNSPLIKKEVADAVGARSAAFVPLVSGERVIAVLAIATTHERRAFSTEELGPLRTLAAEAALALERARSASALEEALRENELRLGQQTGLLNAAQVVTGELRLETVLQVLVDQVTELLGADAADCYLFTPGGETLRCAAVHGLDQSVVGFEFPVGQGLAGRAVAAGAAVREDDYGKIVDPVPHPAYESFSAAIVAPMTWAGETRGVLGVGSLEPARVFSESDVEALATFATLASLALRNAESFEQRERQARVESGFSRIASLLGEPVSLTATLDAVAQAAAEAFGGDLAVVLTPNLDGYRLAGAHGLTEPLRAAFADGLPKGAEVLEHAAREGRTIASSQLAGDERFGDAFRAAAEVSSLLAIPVVAPRSDRGALALVLFREPRSFSDDDLDLAGQLAARAKAALARSELFEVERRSRLLAQQLADTGSLFSGELEPGAVLDEVVEQAPVVLRADACSIRLLEGDELVAASAVGAGAAQIEGSRMPADTRPAGTVVHSRAPVAIEDVAGDEIMLEGEPMLASGYASYLAVPLFRSEGELQGVLAVFCRKPRAWQAEEIEALVALAANASVAFAKAELYQQVELERGRSVAILANVADGIVAVDREERIVLWNAAAERITGVPSEEALGRLVPEVLQRELRSESGAVAGDRLVPIRRGDNEVWLSLTEAVMRDPAGDTAGRIFAFRDISAERVVEQMRSDFVSTVSHELRAPLTSIYGFAATLLREDVQFEEEERSVFLTYIESEAQRLTTIVDKLLSVARLDAGDLELEIAPVDVCSLVSEVVDTAREEAGVNGHEFVVDLPEAPLPARTDPEKLRQVLANLVDNAVRFSPGGGTVTVGAARRGETIVLSVADQGVGIPDTEQERIFSKFYRVGDAQTGGTGVGLFIAQGLVSALGGRITVRSAEGRGSSFVIELPARDGERGVE
jgi:two-component system phosphate regulon sensor histidine kinase PhoR